MSYYTKVDYFTLNTSKEQGDVEVITGLGFRPKLIFFWEMYYPSPINSWHVGDFDYCYGVCNDVGEQGVISGRTRQQQNYTSSSSQRMMDNACLHTYTWEKTGNYSAKIMSLVSTDNDGFTLRYMINCNDANSKTWFLAIGGDELKQTKISYFDYPATTGLFSITNTLFKPDALIIYNNMAAHRVSTGSHIYTSIGWASAPNRQSVVSWFNQSGVGISNTSRYGSDSDIMGCAGTSSLVGRASLNKFDKSGFTLNKLSGSSGKAIYVAMRGGKYRVGSLLTRMDTGDIIETIGYKPGAIMFASANMPKSSAGVQSDHAQFSFGAATSSGSTAAHNIYIPDGWDEVWNWYAVNDNAVYTNKSPASGRMYVKVLNNTGFTCTMATADTAQNWISYFSFAPVSSGTTQHKAYVLGGGQSLLPDSDVYADSWTNSASGTTILYPYLRDSNPSTYITYVNIPVGSGTFEVGLSNPTDVVESGEWYLEYMACIRDSIASGLLQTELLQGSLSIASGITVIGPSSTPSLYRYYLTGNEIAQVTNLNDLRIRMTILGIQ